MIELYEHQKEVSIEVQNMVKKEGLAIVTLPERSGKTLTVIDAVSNIGFRNPLWVTKKNAIESIKSDLSLYGADNFTVINYEMLHKVESQHDVIILDEFHTVSAFPKPSARLKQLQRFKGHPFIYVSATPATESASQWYMPLSLSVYHEFNHYRNFYDWARTYVNVFQKRIGAHMVNDYSKAKDDIVMAKISPYIITRTREQMGFEFHPEIVKHEVKLDEDTKTLIKLIRKNRVHGDIAFDTPTKLISALYQIECGTLKDGEKYKEIGNTEIIDYIKDTWGDNEHMAIMCHWIGQREQLQKHFKHALILSSTSHAEGIELSHIDNLIIASIDYSTARFQQRNARQASKKRTKPIKVNVIVTDGGVSNKVFEAVALKHQNFNARMAL